MEDQSMSGAIIYSSAIIAPHTSPGSLESRADDLANASVRRSHVSRNLYARLWAPKRKVVVYIHM